MTHLQSFDNACTCKLMQQQISEMPSLQPLHVQCPLMPKPFKYCPQDAVDELVKGCPRYIGVVGVCL